ncbi:MAG: hypothetical protein K1X95_05550 [Acidimicrobiia bacterium]|nr:hypothetical protein [Acidimicrobiia bacterium]
MPATRPAPVQRRVRLPVLLCVLLAAAAVFAAACSSSKDSSDATTTAASPDASGSTSESSPGEVDPNQPQQITVGAYTFTMKPQTNPTDVPFPEGTFADIQGFDISKDGSTVMTAYSTTLPPGQTADAGTVDRLLSAAGATDPTPGEVQGQPFTSANLPDGRVVILAVSGDQVAVAIGQNRDQMVNALTETAQAQPAE